MRRGFKTEAERLAVDLRKRLGCQSNEPAPLEGVATDLDVELAPADRYVERARLEELREIQPDAFSGGTFRRSNGKSVVVYNPLHARGRQHSDIAHELSHLLLGHNVRTIERVGNLKFITCDSEQEEEADWMGGCLLLPRDVLLSSASAGLSTQQIADKFETSEPMARFRLNASGVLVQVGRAKAKRATPRSRS